MSRFDEPQRIELIHKTYRPGKILMICTSLSVLIGTAIFFFESKSREKENNVSVARWDWVLDQCRLYHDYSFFLASAKKIGKEQIDEHGAISEAVRDGCSKDLVRAFLDVGGNPNGNGAESPLTAAALRGDSQIINLLLDHRAKPDGTGTDPVLLHAATISNPENLQELINGGAKVDWRGLFPVEKYPVAENDWAHRTYGVTALMVAARHGLSRNCEVLLRAGAKLNLKSASGKTALDYARQSGDVPTIKFLKKVSLKSRN